MIVMTEKMGVFLFDSKAVFGELVEKRVVRGIPLTGGNPSKSDFAAYFLSEMENGLITYNLGKDVTFSSRELKKVEEIQLQYVAGMFKVANDESEMYSTRKRFEELLGE